MTEYTDPVTTVFEIQRTAVEQTHEALLRGADAQRQAAETAMGGLDTWESLQSKGTEASRAGLHAYLDAVEEALPEGQAAGFEEAREAVDENYDRIEDLQAESWAAVTEAVEESLDAYDEAADTYVEAVDEGFDAFLDAHEQVETGVTDATEDAADAVEIDIEAE